MIAKINERDPYLIKYMYMNVTNKDSSDIDKMRDYLINEINHDLSDKYIDLYRKIVL